MTMKKATSKNANVLEVQGAQIQLLEQGDQDYMSLTDMTQKFEGGSSLIEAWLRNKNTVEFLGVWESLYNPNFNSPEFEGIRNQAGLNRFTLSAKAWSQKTNGIGLIAKTGRYGSGTFAHKDIAFEFASWLSPEFKLYVIKEFQRLKEVEARTDGHLEWNIRRTLAKAQYRAHTDAVKTHLIPTTVSDQQAGFIYASEADLLNVALFGQTAKEWKTKNQGAEGNQRDHATTAQLIVLSSLESQNALLIQQGKPQSERLRTLNELAKIQIQSLLQSSVLKNLQDKPLFKAPLLK
jgi:KilA-N domain